MRKTRTSLSLALALITLAGCKDDPLGVNSGDALTQPEIQAFFYALSDAFSSFSGPVAVGPAMATQSYSESFSGSADCPTSGSMSASVSVHATVVDEPASIDASYKARVTPDLCVVPTEGDQSITVDGGPYIQMNLDFTITDTSFGFQGSEAGGISFTSSDGRAGSCRFDVSFTGTATSTTGSSSVSGTVCGVSVDALEAFSVD